MAEKRDRPSITVTDAGDGVLVVAGELDLAGAAILRRALASAVAVSALDLRGVTFIDAAGLHALDDAAHLALRAPSPAVGRLLDLVDQSERFAIES